MESRTPRLFIRENFPKKGRLSEPLPCDRHRAPIRFEEEEGALPVLWLALEVEAEDPIRLHAQAVWLSLRADLYLPAKGKVKALGRCRCAREHLLGRDEPHPLVTSAGDLEGDHDLGDRERMVKEDPGEVAVLRVPADAAPPDVGLGLENLRAAVP